jgi:hypothetical protein
MTSASAEPSKPVTFDATDGSIIIEGLTAKIGPEMLATQLPDDLAAMVSSKRDMGNGWVWVNVGGAALDGNPCTFSLGFLGDHLSEVCWSVLIAGADYTGGWSSPEAVTKEITFMIGVLSQAFGPGQLPGRGAGESARYAKTLPWGTVWCELDPRGSTSASGLRYSAP